MTPDIAGVLAIGVGVLTAIFAIWALTIQAIRRESRRTARRKLRPDVAGDVSSLRGAVLDI